MNRSSKGFSAWIMGLEKKSSGRTVSGPSIDSRISVMLSRWTSIRYWNSSDATSSKMDFLFSWTRDSFSLIRIYSLNPWLDEMSCLRAISLRSSDNLLNWSDISFVSCLIIAIWASRSIWISEADFAWLTAARRTSWQWFLNASFSETRLDESCVSKTFFILACFKKSCRVNLPAEWENAGLRYTSKWMLSTPGVSLSIENFQGKFHWTWKIREKGKHTLFRQPLFYECWRMSYASLTYYRHLIFLS